MFIFYLLSLISFSFAQDLPKVGDVDLIKRILKKAEIKGLTIDEKDKVPKIDSTIFQNFGHRYPSQFRNVTADVKGPFVENFPLRNEKNEVHFIRQIENKKFPENFFPTILVISEKYKILVTEAGWGQGGVIICDQLMECMELNEFTCSTVSDCTDADLKYYDSILRSHQSLSIMKTTLALFEKKDREDITSEMKQQIKTEMQTHLQGNNYSEKEARVRNDRASVICKELNLTEEYKNPEKPNVKIKAKPE